MKMCVCLAGKTLYFSEKVMDLPSPRPNLQPEGFRKYFPMSTQLEQDREAVTSNIRLAANGCHFAHSTSI